jgi:hypothetical protein
MSKGRNKPMSGRDFEALPDAEKERMFRELDNLTAEQVKAARPLTEAQRRQHFQPPRKAGRPKFGTSGTEIISVTVEKSLLKQANAYAKANGMKRSELVTAGLRMAMRTQVKAEATT